MYETVLDDRPFIVCSVGAGKAEIKEMAHIAPLRRLAHPRSPPTSIKYIVSYQTQARKISDSNLISRLRRSDRPAVVG